MTSCQITRIKATKLHNKLKYHSNGIAIALKSAHVPYQPLVLPEQWREHYEEHNKATVKLLTPAHVVAYSSSITAFCHNQSVELEIEKYDLETDLAILSIKNKDEERLFSPSISMNKWGEGIAPAHPLADPNDSFQSFQDSKIYDRKYKKIKSLVPAFAYLPSLDSFHLNFLHFSEHHNSYWPNLNSIIYISENGIAPGMSGTPIFTPSHKSAAPDFAGIITKTEINALRSIAIPAHEVMHWIINANSYRGKRVQNPDLRYSLEYTFEVHNDNLVRTRKGKFNYTDGSIEIFTEGCGAQTWFKNSSWISASGGSWGDGGGSHRHKNYSGVNVNGLRGIEDRSIYSPSLNCKTEGVLLNDTERFVAAKLNGAIVKISQLEDLTVVQKHLKKNEKLTDLLLRSDELTYEDLCLGQAAAFPLKTKSAFSTIQETHNKSRSFSVTDFYSERAHQNHDLQNATFKCSRDIGLVFEVNKGDVHNHHIVNNNHKNPSPILTQSNENSLPIEGKIIFGQNRVNGVIHIKGKTLQFDSERQNFWLHTISLPTGRLTLNLSSDERVLNITFKPVTDTPDLPWITSFNWYSKRRIK